ncbi:MAG: EAL domain-containing protein [Pseudomonadales bacterium]
MVKLKRSNLFALIAFLVVLGVGTYFSYVMREAEQQKQQFFLEEIVNSQAAAFERRLTRSLSATYILAQEVRRSGGDFKDFDKFAAEVIETLGGISNLQLVPKGVIEQIYPLPGNEKAIGHNILRDDVRSKEAWLALEARKLTLAGPFELIQGGIAVIGRTPVFLEKNGEEYFWGFTSCLIFLDDLLTATELDQLEAKGYDYELSRVHPDTKAVEVFAGTAHGELRHPVVKPIRVPNSEWTIRMSHPASFPIIFVLGTLISAIVATLFALLVQRIMREPERLRALVKNQTLQLEQLAFKDELTGLSNRRHFMEQLDQAIYNLSRSEKHLALICLDLDDFKRVNDSMGHEVGDNLLIEVAQRIRASVRQSDLVGRMGGDEFAVILRDINTSADVANIAVKLIESISQPIRLGRHDVVVGATMGITLAPEDGLDSAVLFRNADLAMYASKRNGKNQFSFFDTQMQTQAKQVMLLEEELRRALHKGEFSLALQPIISLADGQLEKFEALIRWQHPGRGELSPGSFIEVAESTGLIVPIGYWVVEAACEFIRQQVESGQQVKPVAINLSARQLRDELFARHVEEMLERLSIAPQFIEFELTETLLMENVELGKKLIQHLRRLGIRISIDDFGTGYSSLSQLKQFPVNTLKIDRGFVQDLQQNDSDRKIIEAITAMVHKLDIKVVAEGIETQAQFDFLKQAGCDYGQGFLFARPLTAERALSFAAVDRPFVVASSSSRGHHP